MKYSFHGSKIDKMSIPFTRESLHSRLWHTDSRPGTVASSKHRLWTDPHKKGYNPYTDRG